MRHAVSLAHVMLLNAIIKWPSVAHIRHWPFAAQHAVENINNTPNSCGFSPKETFSGIKGYRNFKCYHIFGFTPCVLFTALQLGKKITS